MTTEEIIEEIKVTKPITGRSPDFDVFVSNGIATVRVDGVDMGELEAFLHSIPEADVSRQQTDDDFNIGYPNKNRALCGLRRISSGHFKGRVLF